MRLALPLGLSLLAHTLIVALIPESETETETEAETEAETEIETEAETEIETEPLVVELVAPSAPFALAGLRHERRPAARSEGPEPKSIATEPRHPELPAPPTPPPPTPPPPTPSPRHYPPPPLSARDLARTLPIEPPPPPRDPFAPPAPRTPPRPPPSELRPDGNATNRRVDQSVFTARVAPDGRVTFEDKPNFRFRVAVPSKKDLGKHLANWVKDPYGTATSDEVAVDTNTTTIVRGNFDLTDWAMRHIGNDPYQHRKLAMLDRTRDERAGMAANANSENLHSSISTLPRRIRAIWSASRWTAPQRRRLLFELWDECAESGPDEVLAAARRARALIITFIQRELPAGSPHAYPATELAELNAARTSSVRFAPYADTPEPP